MNKEHAERLAIDALSWLAQDPERLGHFLNTSGASPNDLRDRVQDVEFLEFLLDFLLLDDSMILDFSSAFHHPPEDVQRAKFAFSGEMGS